MVKRRALIGSLCLGVLLPTQCARAQPEKIFRLGMLWPGPHPRAYDDSVLRPLLELGYVEGKNLIVDYRFGAPDDLGSFALELVRLKVDVIHAGSSAGTRAAIAATRAIPIVAVDLETDPVASGFASSLARPGGNLTGIFLNFPEFTAKRLEILKEALPRVSRVATLWDSSMDRAPLAGMESVAHRLNLQVSVIDLRDDADLEPAFKRAVAQRAEVVMVMPSPRLDGYKPKILSLATTYRLPVMTLFAHFTADGGLLSYGPNIQDLLGRSAPYVDQVFKGARPANLPIQRPVKFDFVVNMKTAHALHLNISQSVLARADEVIR